MRTIGMSAAVILVTAVVAFTGPSRAAETCWNSYGTSDPPTASDMADEVICLNSETAGVVRESSMFGSGIQGCNTVTVDHKNGGMTLTIDYSKCTNNSPNHVIVCPSDKEDTIKCSWSTKPGDVSDSYLVRQH